jgi:hypothetical protein
MITPKYPKTNINTIDKEWLRARAEAHHRTIVGEISAIRDLIEYFEKNAAGLDVLPHPEGGETILIVEQEN